MKWLVLSLCLFCFSALAEVVCKDPKNVGEESTEAGAVSSNCRLEAQGAVNAAVDRGTNNGSIEENVTSENKSAPSTSSGPQNDKSGESGSVN